MRYRGFGSIPWKVSALGLGCTRLPVRSGGFDSVDVDETEARRMIRHAIDSGVNYVDTAYDSHGGQGEQVLGRVLCEGYRARVHIATKLPLRLIEAPDDFDCILGEQLKRLQTDSIDCYLFYAANCKNWCDAVLRHGLMEKAAAALADGRIGSLGFSFQGDFSSQNDLQIFEEILKGSNLWSFCQFELNYLNAPLHMAFHDLSMVADLGLGVVATDPMKGGRLVNPPAEIRQAMEEFPLERTPTEWALEWLWDLPELSVVLCEMNSAEHLEESLRLARQAHPHCFGTKDQALIEKLREGYSAHTPIAPVGGCSCGICLGRA